MKPTARPKTLYFEMKSMNSPHTPFGAGAIGADLGSRAVRIRRSSSSISSSFDKMTPHCYGSTCPSDLLRLLQGTLALSRLKLFVTFAHICQDMLALAPARQTGKTSGLWLSESVEDE